MMENGYAVILAGGRGERFWPLSTSKKPKQLLALVGDRPLIGMAVDRLEGLIPPERVVVITSSDLVEATHEAAPEIPRENIIGEPFGRDTAPAVALAWKWVRDRDPKGVFCILTADQIMGDLPLYRKTLQESLALAMKQDVLITIGIQPTEPSTGFGYIETGEHIPTQGEINFYKAKRFVEKPDEETAQKYLDAGTFCWNAGMFIWSVDALGKALQSHAPQLVNMAESIEGPDWETSIGEAYQSIEKISIDYALMEKADNIIMAKGVFMWDDVGSWPALSNHLDSDQEGNITVGDVQSVHANHNIVFSEGRLTAMIGVDHLVVVQTEHATLICPKERAQDVKKLVVKLRDAGGYEELL